MHVDTVVHVHATTHGPRVRNVAMRARVHGGSSVSRIYRSIDSVAAQPVAMVGAKGRSQRDLPKVLQTRPPESSILSILFAIVPLLR